MMQVDMREAHVERRHRLARLDGPLIELVQQDAPHPRGACDGFEHRGAFIPARDFRNGPVGSGIRVVDEPHVARKSVLHDGGQPCFLIGRVRIPGVTQTNGKRVPRTRTLAPGVAQIERAVGGRGNERERIVHHRCAPLRRGDIVVLQADGVADFVRGVLSPAHEHERLGVDVWSRGAECRHRPRPDVVVDQ